MIPPPASGGPPANAASTLNARYLIENELGRGGMSRVYAGRDLRLGRRVAIKFLAGGIHGDEELRRFEQEARAAGSLNHPNVLTVHDIGMHDGTAYIVSELLEGGTLRQRLEGAPLAFDEAVGFAAQLADGLAAAHDRGIVHRDLKPENLFVTREGRLKILDFGIAKLLAPEHESSGGPPTAPAAQTQTGAILGTVGYMSPEQVRGEPADRRSDIFSAGAILYEMLSGRRAFKAGSLVETAYSILNDDPPELPEQTPVGLQEVVWRCLEKKPGDRFQSARELGTRLPSLAMRSSPGEAAKATPRLGRLRRLRWSLAAAAALALAVGLLLTTGVGRRARLPGGTRTANEGAGSAPIRARRSVAVLGFKNLSGRPENAWLSTALSEMLTTELAAGEKLRTIPEENVARMKVELALKEVETLAPDSLARVRKNLGADLVVVGAYVGLGSEAGGQIRLDVRLQDSAAGETVTAIAQTGTERNLFELVSTTGAQLRNKLGGGELSPAEAAGVRASFPAAPSAARLYAEGLAKLHVFDALAARELLERAVLEDPGHALAHSALSLAWSRLGYDAKAQDEARKAFDLSASLSREARLGVEGRYRETTHEWSKAVEIYQTLWDSYPDNPDHGLRLVQAQISAGRGKAALATAEALSKRFTREHDDPQIDIAEALAARSVSDYGRQQEAAARAAAKAEAREAKLLVASARLLEGSALSARGEPLKAQTSYEEAQRIYAAAKDGAGEARARTNIAILLKERGDLAGAKAAYEEILTIFRQMGNQFAVAALLNNLANVFFSEGDLDGSLRMHEQALVLRRELGHRSGTAQSLINIANILYTQGKWPAAKSRYLESLAIAREIQDRARISLALNELAGLLLDQGDLAGARNNYQESLAIRRQLGHKNAIAISLNNLGELLREQGDLAGARKNGEEALAIRKELREKGNVAQTELALASLAIEEGHPLEAQLLAHKAIDEFQTEHAADAEADARAILARAFLAQGEPGKAEEAIGRALEISGKSENPARFSMEMVAAQVRAALGERADARRRLQATLAEAKRRGFLRFELEGRLALGQIEMKSGRAAAGRARLAALEREAAAMGFGRVAVKAAAARR